jgi:putative acetyltransferase
MGLLLSDMVIRPIHPSDNASIAKVIRDTLAEFGANHPGTVYFDPTTDHLSDLFNVPGAMYNVAVLSNRIVGGGGIFPSDGLPPDTCELVKMYLLPEVRGIGLGKKLISECLRSAKEMGFQKVYLESMPELTKALKVYETFGFEYLEGPMGNTGHFGCERWMIKSI